jgi:excisionase family DNA binding protein
MTPELLTIAEACARLRVSKSSMYTLIDSGEIRGYRVGPRAKLRRVDAESLEDFLRSRETRKVSSRPPARLDLGKHALAALDAFAREFPN